MPRAWHLKQRPQGLPTDDDFELKDIALPPLEDGMIRLVGVAPSTVRVTDWTTLAPFLSSTGKGRRKGVL